jgi:hypothetical protein
MRAEDRMKELFKDYQNAIESEPEAEALRIRRLIREELERNEKK